jgi:hypothetical protein
MKRQAGSTALARRRGGLARRPIAAYLRIPLLTAVLALAGSALTAAPVSADLAPILDPSAGSKCSLQGKEYNIGSRVRTTRNGTSWIGICRSDGAGGVEWEWIIEQTQT